MREERASRCQHPRYKPPARRDGQAWIDGHDSFRGGLGKKKGNRKLIACSTSSFSLLRGVEVYGKRRA